MPHEDFDSEIEQLAKAHEQAESTMLSLILSYLTGKATYAQVTAGIEQVVQALLQAGSGWVQSVLPRIYADGMRTAQEALEASETSTEVPLGAGPSADAHKASLRLFQEDLAADLAATTNRMSDDAKASLREVGRAQVRNILSTGSNAIPQARQMRDDLEKRGVKFTDRSGRRWDSGAYSRLVLRTHAAEVSNEANLNVARELGSRYVHVFDGGPGDVDLPCIEANNQVWSVEYASTHRIEHPQCRRAFSPKPSSFQGKVDRE